MASEALAILERDGICRWPERVPEAQLASLEAALPWLREPSRRPVPLAPLGDWLATTALPAWMAEAMGPGARPVRALLMGKGKGQDWDIGWHRDTTFALAEPREAPGFHGWVNKGLFYQAQAPLELAARLRSTRLHLDASGPEQGPLLVQPGTHCGLEDSEPRAFHAVRGELFLMHPLLLHASERPRDFAPRRVLHIEWADFELPDGLAWAWF